ncbi:MAG: hypothetical protein ACYTGR_04605 [Planctomycetota bacterium]
MTTNPTPHPVPAPSTAPTKWPGVLGILMVIFGIGALAMYGLMGLGMTLFLPWWADKSAEIARSQPMFEGQAAQAAAMLDHRLTMLLSNLGAVVCAVVLVAAGVAMYKRLASSRRRTWTWCIMKLVYAVPAMIFATFMQMDILRASTEASADGPAAMPEGFAKILVMFCIVGGGFMLLWHAAFPVFMMIWMSRKSIRGEMECWT